MEALERARAAYGTGAYDDTTIEFLFPEVKESGDEWIRKWLIEMVEELRKANPTNAEHNGNCSEAIAYLEKQKEQKPAEWSDSVAKEMFIKALERAVEQTKKGYELTDCDKHSWWEDFKAYCGIAPAEWSEEDEKMLTHVFEAIRYADNHYQFDGKEVSSVDVKVWLLKSLRPSWKPSEEQMECLGLIVKTSKRFVHSEIITSLYNDLKKL